VRRTLRRELTALPMTATPRGRARLVMVQFGIGGVLALVLAALPGQDPVLAGVLGGAAAASACLVLLVRRLGRLGGVATHAVLITSSVFTAAAVSATPDASVAVALTCCYGFIIVVAMAAVSWLGALPHGALALAVMAYLTVARDVDVTAVLVTSYMLVMIGAVAGRILRSAATAEVDALTGLRNRRGAERQLDQVLDTADAEQPLALAFIDLDHLKAVNDTGGHTAGDAALQQVSDDLVAVVRSGATVPPSALVARWGGDEFVLAASVHPDVLRAAVSAVRDRSPGHRGLSAGIVQAAPGEGAGSLMTRADQALYVAKKTGRNTTHSDADPTGVLEAGLLHDLQIALRDGGVDVVYQPVVTPADGAVVGVEALARWCHPVRGPVPPVVFIPVAERGGLIEQLGDAVRARACRDLAQLSREVGRDLLLTVNASGIELSRPDYADRVRRSLAEAGLAPELLVVEVTESSLESASSATRATLETLRDRGVQIAIDDFGTGYSTFSRLDELPADHLKLDAAFTAATVTSERRRTMLRSLVQLCSDLGITVIAEGVETAEQAAVLVAANCALAQGYHYARPLPVDGLRTLLLAATPPAELATDPQLAPQLG
jgi:diguanylate cyclase (GGDEF)-like protein